MPSVRNINVPFLPLFTLFICVRIASVAFKKLSICSILNLCSDPHWLTATAIGAGVSLVLMLDETRALCQIVRLALTSKYNQPSQPLTT